MRVLVTRPEPDASIFAARCREQGFEPVLSPVMNIVFGTSPVQLTDIGALVFTSANGVRAFAAASDARDLPVFAIGAVTGEAARRAGFADIHAANGDTRSLISLIENNRARYSGVLFHAAGEHRTGDLVANLKSRGLEARRERLYQALPADALPECVLSMIADETPPEWVVFFSPRTAALFFTLVEKAGLINQLRHMRAACLSEAVADVLHKGHWKSVEIAKQYDADGIISLMGARLTQSQA